MAHIPWLWNPRCLAQVPERLDQCDKGIFRLFRLSFSGWRLPPRWAPELRDSTGLATT